jgi:DNA-binding transcriptional ArsR family regulator
MSNKKEDLIFKALADPTRRKIIELIKTDKRTTGDICSYFKNLDRCTVMLHLGVLERAGLVTVHRSGRYRYNSFNSAPLIQIQKQWIEKQLPNTHEAP